MRVFKTRGFQRFANAERITDASLCEAVARAERGLIDADLGGGVIKQRVARQGKGRSGGYRTLVAFRSRTRAVFLLGFAKSDQDNIGRRELRDLRQAAIEFLRLSETELDFAVAEKRLSEIMRDAQDLPQ